MEKVENIFNIKSLVLGFETQIHSEKLNFELKKNTLTALIGKNGSGKSTLLSVLCGGEGRLEGNIYINGEVEPVHRLHVKKLAELIAYVPQEHLYPAHFQGVDLLGMGMLNKVGMWGKMPDQRSPEIESIARRLKLESLLGKNLGKMSSGERQRLFLARAILQRAKVLLLDEPTNHLDPGGIGEFWEALASVARTEHLTIIMSTHDLGFIERYADEVLALGNSGIVFHGTKSQYRQQAIASKVFQIPGI